MLVVRLEVNMIDSGLKHLKQLLLDCPAVLKFLNETSAGAAANRIMFDLFVEPANLEATKQARPFIVLRNSDGLNFSPIGTSCNAWQPTGTIEVDFETLIEGNPEDPRQDIQEFRQTLNAVLTDLQNKNGRMLTGHININSMTCTSAERVYRLEDSSAQGFNVIQTTWSVNWG